MGRDVVEAAFVRIPGSRAMLNFERYCWLRRNRLLSPEGLYDKETPLDWKLCEVDQGATVHLSAYTGSHDWANKSDVRIAKTKAASICDVNLTYCHDGERS